MAYLMLGRRLRMAQVFLGLRSNGSKFLFLYASEVLPGRLPDERVLVVGVDVGHPVVADDGKTGRKGGT
jgi:hypothetical protein